MSDDEPRAKSKPGEADASSRAENIGRTTDDGPVNNDQPEQTAETLAPAERQIAKDPNSPVSNAPTASHKTRREFVQKINAASPFVVAVATALLAIAAFLTERQTQKQLETSERPWVGIVKAVTISTPVPKFPPSPASGSFEISYCLNNLGHGAARIHPAVRTRFSSPEIPTSFHSIEPEIPIAQNGITGAYVDCQTWGTRSDEIFAKPPLDPGDQGDPEFPATLLMPGADSCTGETVKNSDLSENLKAGRGLYLVGCVDYEGPTGERYQTQICRYYDQNVSKWFKCPGFDRGN